MTTLLEKIHLNMLARLNAVILVGLVCTGLAQHARRIGL